MNDLCATLSAASHVQSPLSALLTGSKTNEIVAVDEIERAGVDRKFSNKCQHLSTWSNFSNFGYTSWLYVFFIPLTI